MIGQPSFPPPSEWIFNARQFYFWNSRRQVWDIIGTDVQGCPRNPACLATAGNPRADLEDYIGPGASLYEERWIAAITWIYSDRSNSWHHAETITYPPKSYITAR